MPQLKLNGELREFPDASTVAKLLERLELDPRQVAVELNREIVKRARFGEQPLGDGDQVEIVTFVGGG